MSRCCHLKSSGHIRSARIPIDSKDLLDDESVKIELEHVTSEGADSSGIVQTPPGRFTLQSMLDRKIRTGTSIATTASTINPIGIASAIARANVVAMWTVQSATKEALRRAKHPLSISEMTAMLRATGVLRGARSDNEHRFAHNSYKTCCKTVENRHLYALATILMDFATTRTRVRILVMTSPMLTLQGTKKTSRVGANLSILKRMNRNPQLEPR